MTSQNAANGIFSSIPITAYSFRMYSLITMLKNAVAPSRQTVQTAIKTLKP
jgi:hypothetical protein